MYSNNAFNGNSGIQTVIVRSKSNIKNNRTVGIKDAKALTISSFKVYPNPATEMLNVEVSLARETQATITIENILGKFCLQNKRANNSINSMSQHLFLEFIL